MIVPFLRPKGNGDDHGHKYTQHQGQLFISKLPLHITTTCQWHASPKIPLSATLYQFVVNILFGYEHKNYPNRTISTALIHGGYSCKVGKY